MSLLAQVMILVGQMKNLRSSNCKQNFSAILTAVECKWTWGESQWVCC